MDLLALMIFGAIVGWIASTIMGTSSTLLWDVVLGIVGSLVGGFLMNLFGQPGVTGFNLYSVVVGVIGAAVLIYLGRMLRAP